MSPVSMSVIDMAGLLRGSPDGGCHATPTPLARANPSAFGGRRVASYTPAMAGGKLERLEAGMTIVYGGDRTTTVPAELAEAFQPGDHLVVVQSTGDLLHVPAAERERVDRAVGEAVEAFHELGKVDDKAISSFFDEFAARLDDDESFAPIAAANEHDVTTAQAAGR